MPVESAQGWPDGEDADDKDWLDDVIWPAETDQDVPWAGAVDRAGGGRPGDQDRPGDGRPGRFGRRFGPLGSLVVVAVLAAGAGAGMTIALTGQSGTPAAAASPGPGRAPSQLPGRESARLPAGASGGVPGGSPASQMFVIGTVTAVSATSITIGGNGPSVTAAVTASTRVTGRVSSIGGITAGDQVSAQLTQSDGRVTATAIQHPAQQGSGGRMP